MRLPTAYAFALMARVYPRTDAFRVLQLTEEVENLPALAVFVAAIIAFAQKLEPVQIGLVVLVALSVFRFVHLLGFFVPPLTLLLPVSRIYSLVSGYGVLLFALLVFGFLTCGWQGVLAFAVARLSGTALFEIADVAYGRYVFQKTGMPVTGSERSFFHAYRLAASRLGVSTDLSVSDAELAPTSWVHVFADLALKWPVVVARFTGDDA